MADDSVRDLLAGVDLFAGFSRRDLKRLVDSGREVLHQDGHEVVTEGHQALGFHLILEGKASVSHAGAPRRELRPGDFFGEISLIDGKPRSASVKADGPLRTFFINSTEFNALLDDHPEVARGLLLVLCARLRGSESAPG